MKNKRINTEHMKHIPNIQSFTRIIFLGISNWSRNL